MERKPLTKELRDKILEYFKSESYFPECMETPEGNMLSELVSDAEFWREAVKNIDVYYNDEKCPICLEFRNHKPDCQWVLAQ